MIGRSRLVARLADGAWIPEDELLRETGLEPSALAALADWGLVLDRRDGAVRLLEPPELLSRDAVWASIDAGVRRDGLRLEVRSAVESTNTEVSVAGAPPVGQWTACLAEFQTAGRGRRGRSWIQPYGAGISLSVGWSFSAMRADLGSLSLAIGVAALRALAGRCAIQGVSLKWPNDLLRQGGKLGGILCETRIDNGSAAFVVIGIGINVAAPAERARRVAATGGLPVASLADGGSRPPSRVVVAAALVEEIVRTCRQFEQAGFGPFLDEWQAHDALRGAPVRLRIGDRVLDGVGAGITSAGEFLLKSGEAVHVVPSGDVTLRGLS